MKIRLFTIPNLITTGNLACGAAAATVALTGGSLTTAFMLIVIAIVFDFFDGFAARLLNEVSPMGIQLDSLADDITSGFAPAAVMYALYMQSAATLPDWCGWLLFVYTACAALRLAKFNIDTEQSTEFRGLPSPAAALLCASTGLVSEMYGIDIPREVLIVMALAGGILMIVNLRMFSLKFHGFGWRGNEIRYLFMAVSAALTTVLEGYAPAAIIVLYVAISAVRALTCKTSNRKQD